MNNCISLRISAIINELFDGNKSEFARTVGASESAVRSYMTGTTPKANLLEEIAAKTAISCEWLLTGKGEMLRTNTPSNSYTLDHPNNDLVPIIKSQQKTIETQAETINRQSKIIETLTNK